MKREERAVQIWSLLIFSARNRQILSYDLLSKLIGVPRPGLGQLLEPIQSYCILNSLPALTSLVVSEITGLPGEGFIGAQDVSKAQAKVFNYEWLSGIYPKAEDFKEAVQKLPSNGRSLDALCIEAEKIVEFS